MLKPGLYEQLINEQLKQELDVIPEARKATGDLDAAEAPKVFAQYIASLVEEKLEAISDKEGGVDAQARLVNEMIAALESSEMSVAEGSKQLLAITAQNDPRLALGKETKDIMTRPETSLAQSSLFTGAVHEPQMFSELKKEISSADRIDMLVSFIKWSGLRLIINELRSFSENGGKLRIITTSYMGATDVKAVEELSALPGAEIKISYDTKRTRLHAKTYVFHRNTGFTTAYVGSSNLSNAAISSGLEWNVKLTAHDQPATIRKINATFESYWNSLEFEYYGAEERGRLDKALKAEKHVGTWDKREFFFDIRPYPYQQEILDKLNAERVIRGRFKNLLVAATGTGKTVIAAFDYKRFCKQNAGSHARLLFVAHREEILTQSRDTFQGVLRDLNFGELFVGSYTPDSLEHLFISVQTMNSQELYKKLSPDYYDYIIVDEFHHASAPTYKRFLNYFKPKILLGLTATPERMDGESILDYFDNRIAAEIRLPEAVDRKLLSPFQYFGVSDTVDLAELHWTRGGYEKSQLTNLYSVNRAVAVKRARHIIESLYRYVTDMDQVKGLGFCVSKEHAHFMAEQFNLAGIPSISLLGESADTERRTAKERLVKGELRLIFVVDIYNEGVDIPEVNTVLFLRPTESLTIFLQQLGRGLRLSEGKECLTVLDFIGQANKRYNFEEKFRALLMNTKHSVEYELNHGFISAPKGCYVQLEKKAQKCVLENIRASYSGKRGLISRIESFEEDTGRKLTLANFLSHYHMDAREIYAKFSFARLSVLAGVREDFEEVIEDELTKAFSRIVAIDSRRWISFLLDVLPRLMDVDFARLPEGQVRMMRMFYISVWQKYMVDFESEEALQNLIGLADSPVMLAELIELLQWRYDQIDFVDEPMNIGFDCPLDVHCTYTARQILTALDDEKVMAFREGVKWLPGKKTDVFFITLNKSDKDYSPTTMYNDYSINEELFHWQSQSTTSVESPTGQRYIHHKERGSKVILCVREFKNDMTGAAPYTVLGECEFVKCEGNRPMNITWRLKRAIPAKYLKRTNKLVV